MFNRSKSITLVDEVFIEREKEISDITNLIGQPTDREVRKVIAIWGMGGLGKTTVLRRVYRSQQLAAWKRAWVTALRPFNPELLIRSIALQLCEESLTIASGKEYIRTLGLEVLVTKLMNLLETQKCLIVIDDLSTTKEWDSIHSNIAKACRLIITTREKDVVKHCSGDVIYELDRLEEDAALSLFKHKVLS